MKYENMNRYDRLNEIADMGVYHKYLVSQDIPNVWHAFRWEDAKRHGPEIICQMVSDKLYGIKAIRK